MVTLIEHSHWQGLVHERKERLQQNLTTNHTPIETDNDEGYESALVYGAAYRIPQSHVQEVQAYLDIREINGYSIQRIPFYSLDSHSSTIKDEIDIRSTPISKDSAGIPEPQSNVRPMIDDCMIYIGLPSNPQFVGPESLDDVAQVIARSEGPSGPNPEYLFMLDEGLKELGERIVEDRHVAPLVRRVRALLARREGGNVAGVNEGGDKSIGDGAEEFEKGNSEDMRGPRSA